MGKSSKNWSFSMAMLNNQMVFIFFRMLIGSLRYTNQLCKKHSSNIGYTPRKNHDGRGGFAHIFVTIELGCSIWVMGLHGIMILQVGTSLSVVRLGRWCGFLVVSWC